MEDGDDRWPWLRFAEPCWQDGASTPLGTAFREFIKDSLEFPPTSGSTDDFMDGLGLLRTLRDELANIELVFVAEARAYGASWTELGKVLGVGRTAAQKRLGKTVAEVEPVVTAELNRAIESAERDMKLVTFIDETRADQAEEFLHRHKRSYDRSRRPRP